jgi:uncharacterized repeat protein (TIGR04138 family)
MNIDEIDFDADMFEDIMAKDDRYSPRAYSLLMDVVRGLCGDGKHVTGEAIVEEFRETVLDQYGPLSYTVLLEWGVTRCEDIGEMMFNLVDSGRFAKDETDTAESFAGGYDFKESFLGPFEV